MDLPRDPFEHMRKIMEQYSAAERAIQQAQAMDPLFQLRKSMGATAFDAIFSRRRSAVDEAFEQSRKQIAEAQRITDQLRFFEEAERIERATNLRTANGVGSRPSARQSSLLTPWPISSALRRRLPRFRNTKRST